MFFHPFPKISFSWHIFPTISPQISLSWHVFPTISTKFHFPDTFFQSVLLSQPTTKTQLGMKDTNTSPITFFPPNKDTPEHFPVQRGNLAGWKYKYESQPPRKGISRENQGVRWEGHFAFNCCSLGDRQWCYTIHRECRHGFFQMCLACQHFNIVIVASKAWGERGLSINYWKQGAQDLLLTADLQGICVLCHERCLLCSAFCSAPYGVDFFFAF